MIQENELRIGNIIGVEGISVVVDKITDKGINYPVNNHIDIFSPDEHYLLDWLQPIPLTPEILEKCGFIYHKPGKYAGQDQWSGMAGWSFKNNSDWLFRGAANLLHLVGYFNTQIQYLHQLQNLYFALTGNELEVNLNNESKPQ